MTTSTNKSPAADSSEADARTGSPEVAPDTGADTSEDTGTEAAETAAVAPATTTPVSAKPLLSVGLPVYNGGKFIRATLESILNQTFTDFELIISDNGSTDATPQICEEYVQKDSRVRYFHHKQNMGAAWNHNQAFRLARSPFFKWHHYDDLLAPTYLERCLEQLQLHPEAVICFSGTTITNEKDEIGPLYFDHLNLTSPQPHLRWRQALDHAGQGHAFFGVMRANRLGETGLFGTFQVPERVLLAEMSLRGQFIELQEALFFRREHAEVAWAKNKNIDDFSDWLGSGNHKLVMPRWRRFFELIKAVPRAHLGIKESFLCYVELVKHGFTAKKWKGMVEDLQKTGQRIFKLATHTRLGLGAKTKSK